ncbi:MAG TPA: hypothetical protein VM580_11760, partial [Labilithrix sp.]|nr:hypothetical protein [Labilithrix sp.]
TNARRTTWRRGLAFGTGGAGIAALGVGAFFGLRAFEEWGDSESRCPAGRCSREGVELARSAGEAATISTVAFAAGAALMAGGIVLLIMTPKARAVPHVGRGALFEAAF